MPRNPFKCVVQLIKRKIDKQLDRKAIDIVHICSCELPEVPGHIIPDVELTIMSDHELWGILSSIKLLEETLTGIDLENRRKVCDELYQRHPELICPVCKKVVPSNIQQPIVPVTNENQVVVPPQEIATPVLVAEVNANGNQI